MKSVVIVAGGSGSRMQTDIPKQFLRINGKPVIVWTIEKFIQYNSDIQIILVLPEQHMLIWSDIQKLYPKLKRAEITTGGVTRFHSVQKGLELVKSGSILAIHDAVRPLVSIDTIDRCFKLAEKKGSAVPVIDSEDSLREVRGENSKIIDRQNIKRVQTPQVFLSDRISTAYQGTLHNDVTDDASVYEAYYGQIQLTRGNAENIKITYPSDIRFAESMLGLE